MVDNLMTGVFPMLMETVKPQEQETTAEALTEDEIQTLRQSAEGCPNIESERIEVRGGEVIVPLQGKIVDKNHIQQLGNFLFALADHPKVKRLVLELGNVGFQNAAAIGKYAVVQRKMQRDGRELILTGMSPVLHRALQHIGIDQLFNIFRDHEAMEKELEKRRQATASAARSTLGGTSQS